MWNVSTKYNRESENASLEIIKEKKNCRDKEAEKESPKKERNKVLA
jgi:hypothetical protein